METPNYIPMKVCTPFRNEPPQMSVRFKDSCKIKPTTNERKKKDNPVVKKFTNVHNSRGKR